MKITAVEALYLRLPEIQARTDSSQDALLIRIETDAGITGWGEVDGCPWVVKAIVEAPMSHTLVTGLRALLIGEDPLETARLWQKMYERTLYYGREGAVIQAMAGIDLALWDIKGKALGQPVWKLLGGRHRDRLRVYASNMFQFTAEATADRVRKARDEGFTAAKFGWEPFGRDPKTDCAYLEAMRKAAGDDFDLMLDVGLVWDATTTIQRAKLFEPYGLFWIEEPLPPDDLEGYGRVSRAIRQRLAAGEEECTLRGFARLIDQGGIGLAQIDMTRCGLTQSMQIAAHAASPGGAGRQPQLHHRHQHRGLAAFPGGGAERAGAGILRRAVGDLAPPDPQPDPPRGRPHAGARGAGARRRARHGGDRKIPRARLTPRRNQTRTRAWLKVSRRGAGRQRRKGPCVV